MVYAVLARGAGEVIPTDAAIESLFRVPIGHDNQIMAIIKDLIVILTPAHQRVSSLV
jgi:hypothetical protein